MNPQHKFHVEFYLYIIDIILNSLDERFEQLNEVNECFGFLNKIQVDITLEQCVNLEKAIIASIEGVIKKDIDGQMLFEEIKIFETIVPNTVSQPLDILDYIASIQGIELFPNLIVAYKILLTLPVGVASGEASFSKLNLIKKNTYVQP